MKLQIATLFLMTTCLSSAFAEEIKAVSHIDAVTVYPQGADIVRLTDVQVGVGEHTLVLDNLPGDVDPQSIRVEGVGGQGLEIASVDSKIIQHSSVDADAKRKELELQIMALSDERSSLDQIIADAEAQRKLLLSLADKQLVPASSSEVLKTIDPAAIGGLIDLVGTRLSAVSKSVHEAQLRQRAIDRSIGDLQVSEQSLAPDETAHLQVAVHVAASADVKGQFKLSYRLQNAGWQPFYDAKLGLPAKGEKAKLEIIRRAEVMQNTGEVWDNVALTLSTARPSGSTAAPDLSEDSIQIAMDQELRRDANGVAPAAAPMIADDKLKVVGQVEQLASGIENNVDIPMLQQQAMVQLAGFNANYIIAGRVTVDNTGTSKKVRIATDSLDTDLQVITVPRLDPNAYLTAAFTMKGDAPYLPGVVNLFRDGMFVGQGGLPMLNAGEEAKLGFGVDDLIKVKRAEVKRKTGTEGIISTSNVQELAWDISIKNLHDVIMPITVIDRKPFSSEQDIKVDTLANMTLPTVTDLDKKRGVLAWNFDLEPAAEKVLKTGYKITTPQAVHISLNP